MINKIQRQAIESGAIVGAITGTIYLDTAARETPNLFETIQLLAMDFVQTNLFFDLGYLMLVIGCGLFGGIIGWLFGLSLQNERFWPNVQRDAFIAGIALTGLTTFLLYQGDSYSVFFWMRLISGGVAGLLGSQIFLDAMAKENTDHKTETNNE